MAKNYCWTAAELRYLVSKYPMKSTRVIAAFLGLPENTVYQKASRLGLRKSDAYLKSRINMFSAAGKKYQFPKGQVPANKGKKMPEHIRERIKHTWFKKGHLPLNTKFDGHISVRMDSKDRPYAHIRISKGKYVLLHRYIFEQAYGVIPEGMIIVFKNGNTLDVRLDNLELITREENMRRNTIHNYPKDMQETIVALNKLKKTVLDYGEK